MYHIFVDLEFLESERKFRKHPNCSRLEIIEFGAVVLDDNLHEISCFKSYVKPQFSSRIRSKIKDLTGITDSMVACADDFQTVLYRFCDWCAQYGPELTFYEWSDSDLKQILRESHKKGVELNAQQQELLQNWQDAQRIYGDMVETQTQIALETAVWTIGESIAGKLHDALWDARNTARVYRLMQDEENVSLAKQMLHHGTPQESFTCTLADLFDFSKLQLAVQ